MRSRNQPNLALSALAAVLGLACVFPFFWMLRSSFMGNIEIYQYPPRLLPKLWRFSNYPAALSIFPFGRYLINTLTITLPSVLGIMLTSTMAAYALARVAFPLKKLWFVLIIASMLMPTTVTIIPIFKGWVALGAPSGYAPLIVPAFLGGGAFNIFLVRQFLMGIPRDLDEAARIDGAGHPRILVQVLLPLIKPALISVGLFAFILYWNDVLGPLIYIVRNEQNTISQGLANFRGGYGTDYKAIMAASCMSVAPAVGLYLAGQKYFIEGIVLSGLKS
ncbi:MAG TPA: carbohydrate ABC transporter permease [Spirochaetales bacterium]|nr:carbohydrate ABC transporter permease [Spirochaetales bacterium]HRY56329.1 carbohydrate ABC transporter permease [Spirochaetia bacterium]HRZ64242.1 carbohydrate ABC transporter permease [Spirochaetia bacterium]